MAMYDTLTLRTDLFCAVLSNQPAQSETYFTSRNLFCRCITSQD